MVPVQRTRRQPDRGGVEARSNVSCACQARRWSSQNCGRALLARGICESGHVPVMACLSARGSGWWVPHHRQGFPYCCRPPLPCVTPTIPRRDQPVRLPLHFPASGSLPQCTGRSVPAFQFSRPAQRSLALRSAWSLDRLGRPVTPKSFERCRYLHHPLRSLPAGATACRAEFARAEKQCLSTAHAT